MNQFSQEEARAAGPDELPGHLFIPPESSVPPPVDSRLQELPFEKLTWPNFEKLCYRLARSEADVNCCRIYGEAGHDQDGIDLFAKRAGREKWTVYQCKRVKEFGPTAIENAVVEFLSGELVTRTERFVLCTSESMRAPKRWEAIEKMAEKLRTHGVQLETWDSLELNSKLKERPLLVADFFHEAWCKSFCAFMPPNLGARLSSEDVGTFRSNCRVFYEQCFGQADAGWLAGGTGGRPLPPLMQRFIARDVVEKRTSNLPVKENGTETFPAEFEPNFAQLGFQKRPRTPQHRPFQSSSEKRITFADWLARDGQFVLAGEPGAGKSTALRFLALDLLSESPTLTSIARVWGDRLPVWVPFPLWTRRIAERGATAVSLLDLLREWLDSYSNSHLWPLIERAVADERLLLLVDGLDEWRDEGVARIALQLLYVFIGQRNIPAVLVGRPQGLAAIGPFPQDYQEATLAALDRPQQRELIERLLNTSDAATAQTQAFFREIDQLPTLGAIAGVPLLLGLLIRQYLEHARLPVSRFRVGQRMLETLLRDHPIRRQQAALVCTTSLLAERELRALLAWVAWQMHTERPEGLVESEVALEWLITFLADDERGLGYSRPEARRLANDLLKHGEREFGIVVERAPGWCGFFHRTIQELLAAEHLTTLDRASQMSVLRERAVQPQWREVLLAWCHRRSPAEFPDIIEVLEELRDGSNLQDHHRICELLAELATGDFSVPTQIAKRLTRQLVEAVWICEWPRHRERLLELSLDGLSSSHAVRSIVQDAVRAWFPAYPGATYRLAAQTAKWSPSSDLLQALLRTLHSEESSAQRAAAEALGVFASTDSSLFDNLLHIAKTSIRATTRASALESLGRSRIQDLRLIELSDRERHSSSAEVALAAITIRIRNGLQTTKDLRALLRLAKRTSFEPGFYWQPDLIEALLSGWHHNKSIKAAAIKSLRTPRTLGVNVIGMISLFS